MEVYLVRHTTPLIAQGICYGQSDLEVAASFKTEAETILRQLPKPVNAVYTSPLRRCEKLAQLITGSCIIDKRLLELNFGNWELKPWGVIPKKEIQPWYDDYVNTPAFNGESYVELYNRSISFLEEIQLLNYQRVVVVTHSGVIRAILAKYNKVDLKESFDAFSIPLGSITILKL